MLISDEVRPIAEETVNKCMQKLINIQKKMNYQSLLQTRPMDGHRQDFSLLIFKNRCNRSHLNPNINQKHANGFVMRNSVIIFREEC